MSRQIAIQLRSVYGETKAYPADGFAQIFADMLGTKTLTHAALCSIEKLGYEIVTINQSWTSKAVVK